MKDPCRSYMKGRCDKGASCKYWHPPECIFWKKGNCRNGNECVFAHLPKEKASEKGDAKDRSPPPKKGKEKHRGSKKGTDGDRKPDATPAACATQTRNPVRFDDQAQTKTFKVHSKMKRYNPGPRKRISPSFTTEEIREKIRKDFKRYKEAVKAARWRATRLETDTRGKRNRDESPCIPAQKSSRRWIVDSGSCLDLVEEKSFRPEEKQRVKDNEQIIRYALRTELFRRIVKSTFPSLLLTVRQMPL